MEKIDIDNFENIGKLLLGKVNEIVEWINEREKNNRLTMQEVIRLMDEDVRQAKQAGGEPDPK